MARIPYSEKSDAEKVRANWRKTLTLYKRREFSVAIIRAATTCELAVNLALRDELMVKRQLPKHFVDHLMLRANGITNKFNDLLLKIVEKDEKFDSVKSLQNKMARINRERNFVAHSGEFKKASTAFAALAVAHEFIVGLLNHYLIDFTLPAPSSPPVDSSKRR